MTEQDLDDPSFDAILHQARGVAVAQDAGCRPAICEAVGRGPKAADQDTIAQRLGAGFVGKHPVPVAVCVPDPQSSLSTNGGEGTKRSLLPMPMMRSTSRLRLIAVTGRRAASEMRRPQPYMSEARWPGCLIRLRRERTWSSVRTSGSRFAQKVRRPLVTRGKAPNRIKRYDSWVRGDRPARSMSSIIRRRSGADVPRLFIVSVMLISMLIAGRTIPASQQHGP